MMALGVSIGDANNELRGGFFYSGGEAKTVLPVKQEDPEKADQVARLQDRERMLLQDEAAQMATGGMYIKGVPILSYETGPDGRRYVVAVKVQFDTAPAGSPEETLRKAQAIRRAASAASDPAAQDPAIVAAAAMLELQARQELGKEQESVKKVVSQQQTPKDSSAETGNVSVQTDVDEVGKTTDNKVESTTQKVSASTQEGSKPNTVNPETTTQEAKTQDTKKEETSSVEKQVSESNTQPSHNSRGGWFCSLSPEGRRG